MKMNDLTAQNHSTPRVADSTMPDRPTINELTRKMLCGKCRAVQTVNRGEYLPAYCVCGGQMQEIETVEEIL